LLWMHAIFVSPETAANYGNLWLATRAAYPVGFYLGYPKVAFFTVPGYIALLLLAIPLLKYY